MASESKSSAIVVAHWPQHLFQLRCPLDVPHYFRERHIEELARIAPIILGKSVTIEDKVTLYISGIKKRCARARAA
jgi:hypothetical protein